MDLMGYERVVKGETLCIKGHFIWSEKWKLKYSSRPRGSRGLKKEVINSRSCRNDRVVT